MTETAEKLSAAAAELSKRVSELEFPADITHIYNPLEYAWDAHSEYIERFGASGKKVVFLGMNPGPWGMAQTGIPFGEIEAVVSWLEIKTPAGNPAVEHPKRPVEGFLCKRSEVSGRRLWGLMKDRFGTADEFFREHYVLNYCPLSFMTETGRNFTPDKFPAETRDRLFGICGEHLVKVLEALDAEWAIGVGKFAEQRIKAAVTETAPRLEIKTGNILHPSPASPAANRGWAEAATKSLENYGIWRS